MTDSGGGLPPKIYGGGGGGDFSDRLPDGARIGEVFIRRGICGRSGDLLDSIGFWVDLDFTDG